MKIPQERIEAYLWLLAEEEGLSEQGLPPLIEKMAKAAFDVQEDL